jgi:hydroxyacylglutathione hydrolase
MPACLLLPVYASGMLLRMVYDDKLAAAAYVVGCQRTGEAIVIDPQRDVDRYERLAGAHGLRLTAAAETHIHADFLSGVRELAERGVRAYLSDEGDADWKYEWPTRGPGGRPYDHRLLKDGDVFSVGRIEFRVIHTPGHTPEHVCFMVTDRGGGADQPIGVFTGDFVFVGDVGRPDLLEAAAGVRGHAEPAARRLFRSLATFRAWPEYLQVWPGHGAGSACGKALGAVPQSTVGYEKLFNGSVQAAASEQAFVEFILEGQPEPPVYFARMKRENRAGPRVLGAVPAPRQVRAGELVGAVERGVCVVDTRPWPAFKGGHPARALHLPLTNAFSTDGGSMIRAGEEVVLLVEPSGLEEAVRGLIRVGIDMITGWFDARELSSYGSAGGAMASADECDAGAAAGLMGSGGRLVLDVRRGSEFAEGRVPGAMNIAHTSLLNRLGEVPRDRPILVNCRSGMRSARACALLLRHGYEATNLAGGFLAWEKAGLPVEHAPGKAAGGAR